jgi:hypothetical protein
LFKRIFIKFLVYFNKNKNGIKNYYIHWTIYRIELHSFIVIITLHRIRLKKVRKSFHIIDLILLEILFKIQLLFDSNLLPTRPRP